MIYEPNNDIMAVYRTDTRRSPRNPPLYEQESVTVECAGSLGSVLGVGYLIVKVSPY